MSPLNMLIRLLAPYEKFNRSRDGSLAERKQNLGTALRNCQSTIDVATKQMPVLKNRMLLEDLLRMRADAIAAVPIAEAALAAASEDDFIQWLAEFEAKYDLMVGAVRAFVWDSGPAARGSVFGLIEEIL